MFYLYICIKIIFVISIYKYFNAFRNVEAHFSDLWTTYLKKEIYTIYKCTYMYVHVNMYVHIYVYADYNVDN